MQNGQSQRRDGIVRLQNLTSSFVVSRRRQNDQRYIFSGKINFCRSLFQLCGRRTQNAVESLFPEHRYLILLLVLSVKKQHDFGFFCSDAPDTCCAVAVYLC